MEVDKGRNYYDCRRFEHITKHCRNWELVVQGKRIKYRDNYNIDNLKEKENLVVLD